MFDKYRLTHRVTLVVCVFWLVFLAVAATGFHGMRQARASMALIHDVRMDATEALSAMTRGYLENRIQILMAFQHDPDNPLAKFHNHGIEMHFQALEKARQLSSDAVKVFEARDVDQQERAMVADIGTKRKAWQGKRDLVLESLKSGVFSPDVMAFYLGAVANPPNLSRPFVSL
jgi:hypothetical protein